MVEATYDHHKKAIVFRIAGLKVILYLEKIDQLLDGQDRVFVRVLSD